MKKAKIIPALAKSAPNEKASAEGTINTLFDAENLDATTHGHVEDDR